MAPEQKRTKRKVPAHTPCGYCFSEWATAWDHLIPWSYRHDNSRANLYPTCKRCNSILHSKMFETLEEKRQYVRAELISRNEWKLPLLWEELPQAALISGILLQILPMDCLGPAEPSTEAQGVGETPPAPTVLVRKTRKVRRRREAEMRESLHVEAQGEGGMEATAAGHSKGVHGGAGKATLKLRKCALNGCLSKFPLSEPGRRFCSGTCRAKSSVLNKRLAHRVPLQTAERKALRMAAVFLGGRL